MTRSYEFGVQMLKRSGAVQYDGWMAWQRLNTAEARERIDAGVNGQAVVVQRERLRVEGRFHDNTLVSLLAREFRTIAAFEPATK